MTLTRQELLDLVEDLVGVDDREMVVARKLDEARPWDQRGDPPPARDRRQPVARPVEDQGGSVDRRQDVPDIGMLVHAKQLGGIARSGAAPQEACPLLAELRIVTDA